eukprot:SAG11_NODE_627_length_8087_cov_3.567852_9_plen_161_part_00
MNFNIGPLIRAVGLFTVSLMFFHFFGCIWHYAGTIEDIDMNGQIVYGWTNFSRWDDSSLYFASIYTSIYGSVDDPTTYEMLCLILLHFLINGIMYGMVTASLASLLMSMSASRQLYVERMECIRDWLSMRQISPQLRSDVYDFFTQKYSSEKIFDENGTV